jgi:ribosomal-protein-alanine N-acetyltransferase
MIDSIKKILTSLNIQFDGRFILVDLEEYINKIISNATIITYYEKGIMCGFIAFYNNDFNNKDAFLTILAIDPKHLGKGIGDMLLKSSISRVKHDKFEKYFLEVIKNNDKAINLYKRNGFTVFQETENHFKMILRI